MITICPAAEERAVSYFRPRLKQLMLTRAAEIGERLTQREFAEVSGVPIATLSRWYRESFARVDADTARRLTAYFNCTLDELLEIVDG